MKFLLCLFLINFSYLLIESRSNLTIDDFFNYTIINSISLSPNGDYLIVQTRYPRWDLNTFEDSLWLFKTEDRSLKSVITNQYFPGVKYQWSPNGTTIVFLMKSNSTSNTLNYSYLPKLDLNFQPNLYFYSVETEKVKSISIENDYPTALTWSTNDSSLFYSAFDLNSTSVIRHIEIVNDEIRKQDIVQIPFLISELLFSSIANKLIFLSATLSMEYFNSSQIYSVDLRNRSSIKQITNGQDWKSYLQLSIDEKNVFFLSSIISLANLTQQRLYSVELTSGQSQRWFAKFQGNIQDYAKVSNGGIYMLGQLGTDIGIYSSYSGISWTFHDGWAGSYQMISTSSIDSITFVFTHFKVAQEAYFIPDIEHLNSAPPITNFNPQYTDLDIPQADSYRWTNSENNQTIEGILHYPPDSFGQKKLPLLVLIHGGPTNADISSFLGHWHYWAPLAAAQGWLVLQPNYRGSTGYGDEFVNQIRYEILTNPSKDILSGVDQLIKDELADPNRLSVGGYSYGGILTNWLITQTTRFKAALSGAGSVEHVSFWGMQDTPAYFQALLGGFPWEKPQTYQSQSAIYHFDRIRTPTHIVAGTADVRVPFSQSLMLERSLHYLNIPVQLLLLPNEQHAIANNPWHGKIKVREEIQWLKLYG